MDLGCYCVSASRLIAGAEPISVQADAIFGQRSHVDEVLDGLLRFPNEVIAVFDCSFRTAYREGLSIAGSEGRIEVPRFVKPGTAQVELFLHHADDTVETITAPAANHYQVMVEDFANAVLNSRPLRHPIEESRANLRVIDALYESARTGKRQDLSAKSANLR